MSEFFKDNTSQWKSGKFDPPLPQKPPNRSSPKFAWVTTSWTPNPMQNFIKIPLPPFAPPNTRKFASIDSASFFGFFCQPTAKTHAPIFTIDTSNDVVSRKDVPFGVSKTKFYILTPFSPKNEKFLANFRWD